jgi:hypothetical protein
LLAGPKQEENLTTSDALFKLLHFKPLKFNRVPNGGNDNNRCKQGGEEYFSPQPKRLSELENVAEHETLVTLMTTIETAVRRKNSLLGALEEANTLMARCLSVGAGPKTTPIALHELEQHYAWLVANLESSNQVLDVAFDHLRILYGSAYLPVTCR